MISKKRKLTNIVNFFRGILLGEGVKNEDLYWQEKIIVLHLH